MAISSSALGCFCGRLYTNSCDLEDHRRARGHFASHICGNRCNHPTNSQVSGPSQECGCCGKVCERQDILDDHRIATGHCYCSDCNLPFKTQHEFETHRQKQMHASEFKCCDCNISFKDIHALNAHMASRAHRKPLPQKPPQNIKKAITIPSSSACTECKRTFPSPQALLQHRQSLKHHPLSDLACPMHAKCRRGFPSPSALLQHLESGNCLSGTTRSDIYRILQSCDQGQALHKPPERASLGFSDSPAHTPSHISWIETDSSDTESEWSTAPTPTSEGFAQGGLALWSLLESRQVGPEEFPLQTAMQRRLQCALCPSAGKKFATEQALQQHMQSAVHCPKVYHCPSNAMVAAASTTTKHGEGEKRFSTLGGLAQHVESGACYGGKSAFLGSIEFIQRRLDQLGLGGMLLLLPGCRK